MRLLTKPSVHQRITRASTLLPMNPIPTAAASMIARVSSSGFPVRRRIWSSVPAGACVMSCMRGMMSSVANTSATEMAIEPASASEKRRLVLRSNRRRARRTRSSTFHTFGWRSVSAV